MLLVLPACWILSLSLVVEGAVMGTEDTSVVGNNRTTITEGGNRDEKCKFYHSSLGPVIDNIHPTYYIY